MVPPTPPAPPEEIRAIANASGSSLVQLGLGAVKDKIFTTSQYLSDPAVRRAMGLQSYGATQNQQLVSETYGFSTGGTGGVVYKPEVPTWKPTLARGLGHVGRNVMREQLAGQEPNILRRYGLGVEPTIPDAALGDDAANPKMEREELQQRALDLKVAQNLKEAGVYITRHRLSARKSSHRLHRKTHALSAGISAARGHLGAQRSRHHRRRREVQSANGPANSRWHK